MTRSIEMERRHAPYHNMVGQINAQAILMVPNIPI